MNRKYSMDEKWPRGPLYQLEDGALQRPPRWVWAMCLYTGLVTGALICVCVLGTLHLDHVTRECQDDTYRQTGFNVPNAEHTWDKPGAKEDRQQDKSGKTTEDRAGRTQSPVSDRAPQDPRASVDHRWDTTEEEIAHGHVIPDVTGDNDTWVATGHDDVIVANGTARSNDREHESAEQDVDRMSDERYTLMDSVLNVRARVMLKPAADRAVYYVQATSETSSGVAVVDFTKHEVSLYISDGKDQCYHLLGFDKFFPNLATLSDLVNSDQPMEPTGTEHFDLVNNPTENILDWTDLPRELWDICWGKHVYLLQHAIELPTEHGMEATLAVVTGSKTLFLVIRNR